MSTFITRLDSSGAGPRLAVKDLIDVTGVPTTAGTKARADGPAAIADAPLLAGARAAGARIVGKANLHELAFGASGINPWFGTPTNPADPALVPGGSSSGSAVAVGSHEADVAYGSDTGGSVRIPSACCATAGLKTTHGRISLEGVWPLATSLDTVGPMARDVDGLILGMSLLEPGFAVASTAPVSFGRVRLAGTDPAIDAAIDAALAASEFEVADIDLPGWAEATIAALYRLLVEAWDVDAGLLADHPDGVGADVADRIRLGGKVEQPQRDWIGGVAASWRDELAAAFGRVELLALPTLLQSPPRLEDGTDADLTGATAAVNLGGNPALSLPVPATGPVMASLQLVGPLGGEEILLAAGRRVEAAAIG